MPEGNSNVYVLKDSSVGGDLSIGCLKTKNSYNYYINYTVENISAVLTTGRLNFNFSNRIRIACSFLLAAMFRLFMAWRLGFPIEEFKVFLIALKHLTQNKSKSRAWFKKWVEEIGKEIEEAEISKEKESPEKLYKLADKLILTIAIVNIAGHAAGAADIYNEKLADIISNLQMCRTGIIQRLELLGDYEKQLAQKQKDLRLFRPRHGKEALRARSGERKKR